MTTTETQTTSQTDTTESDTTTTDTSTENQPCSEEEGEILGYLPVAKHDCGKGKAVRQEKVFRADRLTTETEGTLEFHTSTIDTCKMRSETSVVIVPDDDTALRLLNGTVACNVEPGATRTVFAVPGAEIEITGTLFTLTAVDESTTIKVSGGTLQVRATVSPGAVQEVSAAEPDRRAAVVSDGEPLQYVEFAISPEEFDLIAAVRNHIVTLPPEALAPLTDQTAANAGTVLTETKDQGQLLRERGVVARGLPLVTTGDLALQAPEEFVQVGDTVVGVGSFSALEPSFSRLRETFGDRVTLIYSPGS
jgi:hypothetical protein